MTEHPAVAFLLAAHERAEQLARNAGGDEWERDPHPLCYAVKDSDGDPVVCDEGAPTGEQASHIALHDPAAVLRRVAAEREILAEHPEHGIDGDCARCVEWQEDDEGDLCAYPLPWPCRMVLGLAKAWGWEEPA